MLKKRPRERKMQGEAHLNGKFGLNGSKLVSHVNFIASLSELELEFELDLGPELELEFFLLVLFLFLSATDLLHLRPIGMTSQKD